MADNLPANLEDRIEQKLDLVKAGSIVVSDTLGGLMFTNMTEVMEFAKLMALSRTAVRKHLRNNPGACLAVCIQALEWRMSPYAVANKSYEVNDQIAYESQLIHAIIEARAPLQKRLRCTYTGEGVERTCKVIGLLKGETEPHEYESPKIKDIKVKNSPLWLGDPDQQLFYYSSRSWGRKWVPDVILGIYAEDELPNDGSSMRDITPGAGEEKPDIASRLSGAAGAGFNETTIRDGAAAIEHKPEQAMKTIIDGPKEGEGEPVVVDKKPSSHRRTKPKPVEDAKEVVDDKTPVPEEDVKTDKPPFVETDDRDQEDEGGIAVTFAATKQDKDALWLADQISRANECKTLADLDTLDPDVYRALKDRKDLQEQWNDVAYEPNKARLIAEQKAARQKRIGGDGL